MWVRMPIFFLLMGFMGYRIVNIVGALNTFEKIGMVFVTMCLVTTAIAVLLGSYLSPRSLVFLLSNGNSSAPAWRKEIPAAACKGKMH